MFSTKKVGQKIRNRIDKALDGTHHHFSCYLPAQIGIFASFLLKQTYRRIPLGHDQTDIIRQLPEDAIVVYVNKQKSRFEYLFYYTRYKTEKGVPQPEIALDQKLFGWQPISRIFKIILAHIDYFLHHLSFPNPFDHGYIKQQLLEGKATFLALVEKKDFYRRFVKAHTDPLKYLIEIQKTTVRPIFIIPQLFFFGKKPRPSHPGLMDMLFGSEQAPGTIRKFFTLWIHPKKIFIEISEPVNLKALINEPDNTRRGADHLALILRRNLLAQINRHRQSIIGPILKTGEELKQDILTNERLREFMQKFSKRRDITIHQAHREAHGYLDEIAADYNPTFIKIGLVVVKWLFNTLFDGISLDTEGLRKLKNASRKGPMILIPCHKSHIDYLVLSYTLYHQNMPCPHIFAGKNLSFWPMGPLFRRVGAFFVRRSFGGAVFYSKVFSEYIFKLLEEGFNIEVFIEGTRSRTGKLLPPQLGMLSILLNAHKFGACEDLTFVPIFIGYDRVPEEKAYLHEVEGGKKEPESLKQFIRAGKVLKKRYGKIYINFSDPLSLNAMLAESETSLSAMTSKEQNQICRELGSRVLSAIDNLSVVTPRAIAASVLLNNSKSNISRNNLMDQMQTFKSYLLSQDARLSETLIPDHVRAADYILGYYVQKKFIEKIPINGKKSKGSSGVVERYRINTNKRSALEYYKNTCISFFIPAAFTALAILERQTFQFSAGDLHDDYRFLKQLFINEFMQNPGRKTEYAVRKNIKAFIDDDIITPHATLPDTYDVTAAGLEKLKLFAGFAKTFLESYLIVLRYFERHSRKSDHKKNRLKKIDGMGNRMFRKGEIDRKEAISKITFETAADFFIKNGIKGNEHIEKIRLYEHKIKSCLRHLP